MLTGVRMGTGRHSNASHVLRLLLPLGTKHPSYAVFASYIAQLLYLDSVDPNKDITLYINSPGGSVTAGPCTAAAAIAATARAAEAAAHPCASAVALASE